MGVGFDATHRGANDDKDINEEEEEKQRDVCCPDIPRCGWMMNSLASPAQLFFFFFFFFFFSSPSQKKKKKKKSWAGDARLDGEENQYLKESKAKRLFKM